MEDIIFWLEEISKPNNAEEKMVILSIISIITSTIAIFFAYHIPKKIAKKQNDIALFEKRYELYFEISNFCELGNNMFIQYEFLNSYSDVFEAKEALSEYSYIDWGLNDFFKKTTLSKTELKIEIDERYIDKIYRASIANYFKSQLFLVKKIAWLFDGLSSMAFEKYLLSIIHIFDDEPTHEIDIVNIVENVSKESDDFVHSYLVQMERKLKL